MGTALRQVGPRGLVGRFPAQGDRKGRDWRRWRSWQCSACDAEQTHSAITRAVGAGPAAHAVVHRSVSATAAAATTLVASAATALAAATSADDACSAAANCQRVWSAIRSLAACDADACDGSSAACAVIVSSVVIDSPASRRQWAAAVLCARCCAAGSVPGIQSQPAAQLPAFAARRFADRGRRAVAWNSDESRACHVAVVVVRQRTGLSAGVRALALSCAKRLQLSRASEHVASAGRSRRRAFAISELGHARRSNARCGLAVRCWRRCRLVTAQWLFDAKCAVIGSCVCPTGRCVVQSVNLPHSARMLEIPIHVATSQLSTMCGLPCNAMRSSNNARSAYGTVPR